MEPRPLNKPTRPATPPPAAPPRAPEPAPWVPAAPPGAAGYGGPASTLPGMDGYRPPTGEPIDASRTTWYGPPDQGGPGMDRPYSPGPALSPIDAPRGSRFLGPVLAMIALLVVIGAAAFAISRANDGDNARGGSAAAQTATAGAALAQGQTPTTTDAGAAAETPTAAATQPTDAVAGAAETAVTATVAGDAPAAAAAEPSSTPKSSSGRSVTARSFLPATDILPSGFRRTENDKRTKDGVAQSFADPEEAMANLGEWGWKENVYRTFTIPEENNPNPESTTYVQISVHRFADKKSAAEALTYFADAVIAAQGLERVEVDQIGDQTLALSGAPDGVNLVVLYVRTDNFLIRIGGSSPAGNPTETVVEFADDVIE